MLVGPALLFGMYLTVHALHAALPGVWVDGYVRDAAGRPLRYRLNGIFVFSGPPPRAEVRGALARVSTSRTRGIKDLRGGWGFEISATPRY